jgi:F1F0 ATPase subunit 2
MMYAVAALAGILFGVIYFGGLWLTIQKMGQMDRPILLLTGSFIVRLALVLVGFISSQMEEWNYLAVSLITFFLTRFYYIRKIQPTAERSGTHMEISPDTQLSSGNQEYSNSTPPSCSHG